MLPSGSARLTVFVRNAVRPSRMQAGSVLSSDVWEVWPYFRFQFKKNTMILHGVKFISNYRTGKNTRLKKKEAIQPNLFPLGAKHTVMFRIWARAHSAGGGFSFCMMVTGSVSLWQIGERHEKDSLIMMSKRKNLQMSGDVLNNSSTLLPICIYTLTWIWKGTRGLWGQFITAKPTVWENMDFH